MHCNECDAVGETCCQASKERRATAVSLARRVALQNETIRKLLDALEVEKKLLREILTRTRI